MAKKIAVMARDRQKEALRMALGIILMDDKVDLYVLDRKVEEEKENMTNIETMKDLDVRLFSNCRDNNEMEYVSTEEIARKVPEYDHVIPY